MEHQTKTIGGFALRLLVAIGMLALATDLFVFAILFGFIGVYSELARSVNITCALLHLLGSIIATGSSVLMVCVPSATPFRSSGDSPPNRGDKIVASFVSVIGGTLIAFMAFVLVWLNCERADLAVITFHGILSLSAILGYCYPQIVPQFSLEFVASVAREIGNIFG